MKSSTTGAKKYFDQVPKEWDSLYATENRAKYAINKLFRPGLYNRYDFAFKNCGDLTGATVLDIGCGTGRYSIECARRGARHVVGIDFAVSMVDFSKAVAKRFGLSDQCEFICGDIRSHDFGLDFDVVLAMGFFDYIEDPKPIFRRISNLMPKHFIASFPKHTTLWGLQRHIRYELVRHVPIFDYSIAQLETLFEDAGFINTSILETRRGFLASTNSTPNRRD